MNLAYHLAIVVQIIGPVMVNVGLSQQFVWLVVLN